MDKKKSFQILLTDWNYLKNLISHSEKYLFENLYPINALIKLLVSEIKFKLRQAHKQINEIESQLRELYFQDFSNFLLQKEKTEIENDIKRKKSDLENYKNIHSIYPTNDGFYTIARVERSIECDEIRLNNLSGRDTFFKEK